MHILSQTGKSKSLRNTYFLKHHTCFWSNLCCTKLPHIESRTVPFPGQKPHANSHSIVFFHISLLHQLSKLKATNLLFISSLCVINASGLCSSHCFSFLSGALFLSWSLPFLRNMWNLCKFSLYLSCPLHALSMD